MLARLFKGIGLYRRARSAARYGDARGIPGMPFNRFGRRLGWKVLPTDPRAGATLVLVPVFSVRYFEFDFALACLPPEPGRCCDVSSPRLFALYVAANRPSASVVMFNPDSRDLTLSRRMAEKLRLRNIDFDSRAVDALRDGAADFDVVWSLSVIEHIDGEYDDRAAVSMMFDVLKPGGRLILTVPVDRQFSTEYHSVNDYGTQQAEVPGRFFFQRLYNEAAIRERIVSTVGRPPTVMKWFGETVPGHFREFEARRRGIPAGVDYPREIADHYRQFDSWADMPGLGVCGLMFEK